MTIMTASALDPTGFCRTWRDSNGHLFTLERIEPDLERGGDHLLLHGTSSNCECVARGWQAYSHDGPYICYTESAQDLATGNVFGWNPETTTLADVRGFVQFLLGLTPEEWSHIRCVVEDDGQGEEYRDYEAWVSPDVVGALHGLARIPREGLTPYAQKEASPHAQAALLSAMVAAGHTDPEVIAFALLLVLDPEVAVVLPVQPSEDERATLLAQMATLDALRSNNPPLSTGSTQ